MPTDIPPAPSAAIPLLTLDNIGKSYVGPVLGGVGLRFALARCWR